MRCRPALAALLAIAACRQQPAPTNTSVALDGQPPLATPAARIDRQERPGRDAIATERTMIPEIAGLPVAEGHWTLIDGVEARFGAGGDPAFIIRCDRQMHEIILTRDDIGATAMQILTDRGANRFDAEAVGASSVARFSARFPWFKDVLAKAAGPFGIRLDDGAPLVLPADPSIATVIGGCL